MEIVWVSLMVLHNQRSSPPNGASRKAQHSEISNEEDPTRQRKKQEKDVRNVGEDREDTVINRQWTVTIHGQSQNTDGQ